MEAAPWVMRSAAPMWAATASQVSVHHRSRSSAPSAAWAVSNMAAIAATLRAHAADSTRAHAANAPAPDVPAVASTKSSNILSILRPLTDESHSAASVLWMDRQPVDNLAWSTENVGVEC